MMATAIILALRRAITCPNRDDGSGLSTGRGDSITGDRIEVGKGSKTSHRSEVKHLKELFRRCQQQVTPPSRNVRLIGQEDARLQEIEQAHFKREVGLRVQLLRLSLSLAQDATGG
jgi:hypothetical protein